MSLACGGGGGGSDSSFALDACSAVASRSYEPRLINGESCSRDSSSVVLIRATDLFDGEIICSATAISSDAVLTAAHCITALSTSVSVETGSQSFPAISTKRHPQYRESSSNTSLLFDVAVVKTASPLGVPAVPMLVSRRAQAGEEAIIAGFGLDESGSAESFKAGNMIVSEVTNDHVIAQFNGEGSNTCVGDSGGPLLVQNQGVFVIAGVTSTGVREDCGVGDISLFASLENAANSSFIIEQVRDASLQ